ncbi:SDR family oxidoreductase [Chengkuizengella axinellae]|uniref:SDR family oxidoreductase n=1 Tax=Chengkuizengella axinellae TaxID=3064388 RepID=A0ABT9J2Z5_9BACL|nr:SDR family oxidoreductase [Chengkuizengella sp. 2205SS18-9]MDP5275369.1 SDR family oxidoreductase [Chengkuizengella sp. 2205SS18-9]
MEKQIAVITGTSTGLGLTLTQKLANEGWKVYATMRNLEKGQSIRDLQQSGLSVELLQLDVQSQDSVDKAIQTVIDQEGQINLLVNNAGIGYIKTTEQSTEKEYTNVFDINTFGAIRCTKAVLPHMRERKQGKIVAISSVGGLVGQPLNEIYCASKFALEGYYESLATYVTPYFGVEFMIVEPGGISSEFANSVLAGMASNGGFYKDDFEPVVNDYMGTRSERSDGNIYQTPSEVADVVLTQLKTNPFPLRVRTSEWAEDFCQYKTKEDPTGLIQTKNVVKQMLGK